jgi:hypothetical protein
MFLYHFAKFDKYEFNLEVRIVSFFDRTNNFELRVIYF